MMRIALILLLPVLSACSNLQRLHHDSLLAGEQLGLRATHQLERRAHWVLPESVHIQVAAGGVATESAPDQPAALLVDALRQRFARVDFDPRGHELAFAQDQAQANGADYLLYPRWLLWQDGKVHTVPQRDASHDGAVPLSQRFARSETRLLLTLVDLRSGEIVDTARLDAGDGRINLRGRGAERLMREVLDSYVDRLAGVHY